MKDSYAGTHRLSSLFLILVLILELILVEVTIVDAQFHRMKLGQR